MNNSPQPCHGISGYLNWVLRLEGLAVLISAFICYASTYSNLWKIFFILFFAPDISFLGYLIDKKVGAFVYNVMHSYVSPLCIGILFWSLSFTDLNYIILIWVAHIGFDRALGYGLKYSSGFTSTHLGKINIGNQ